MPAPQHSVTATIQYISMRSDAWDSTHVIDERKRLGARGGEHPFPAYFSGETRYDLDAPGPVDDGVRTPKSYLREGSRPLTWELRRLGIREVSRCEDIGGTAGELEAFALAVIGATNLPHGVNPPTQGATRRLLESTIDELAEAVGMDQIFEVGRAAMNASRAPSPAEKKP